MAAMTAGGGKIKFSTPTIVDPIHTFGEPSINLNLPRNEFFASGPTGTGTQRSVWYGSVDQGHTFRAVAPNVPPNAIQTFNAPPGGGDTDINFDRKGNEYFADLYALLCLRSAVTPDGGATVNQGFDACGHNGGADRQWLAVYNPPPGIPHQSAFKGNKLIYLEYNDLVSGANWNKSTDGTTWSEAVNCITSPADEVNYSPFGADGYPQIDQQTGKVFQAAGTGSGSNFSLKLNIGTPDSSGNLTFLDHPTACGGGPNTGKLITIAKGLPGSPDLLFSVLSMDRARNLFVAYTVSGSKPAQDQTFVSAASASSGWRKWTKPVQVSDGSPKTGDAANIFPWIKAGGPGRADAVWYGQNKSSDPSAETKQKWNVFMSQVVFPVNSSGQITGAAPHKTLVKVTPHPMHYGAICLQGTGCIQVQGNRNVADFFSDTIDKHGAAEIIYDDTSNGLVQPGFTPTGQQADHAGAPLVTIAHQSSGMGLFGKPIHEGSNAPVSGMNDPAGDARYPLFGSKKNNVSGMDIRHSSLALSSDGKTLTVKTKIVDLSNPSNTMSAVPGTQDLQYITRWQMGKTLYFAGMSTSGSSPSFYAGKTGSIDLCSVSACDPHVLIYPEMSPSPGGGSSSTEKGKLSCPKKPSASSPCTITIMVKVGDVGKPTTKSLLEEVGAYAFASSHPQWLTTNPQAQADNVPLEIDGVCCFNFNGAHKAVRHHHHHVTHHHHRHHHHHVTTRHHHHRVSKKPKSKHRRGFTG